MERIAVQKRNGLQAISQADVAKAIDEIFSNAPASENQPASTLSPLNDKLPLL